MLALTSPTSLAIRFCQHSDFSAIAHIYNESVALGDRTMDTHSYTVAEIAAMVKRFNDRECILVAQQAEQILGWGIIKRYSDRPGYHFCCETSIYLCLGATGNGYGTHLQRALLSQVALFGYHHIVVKILAANTGSIRFHQRFGFEMVGIQTEIGYLNGCWHDVVILQRLLPQDGE
ncbi:MAG: N-acetyltransferase family protein [Cyanobacteria bacterium J06638_20]